MCFDRCCRAALCALVLLCSPGGVWADTLDKIRAGKPIVIGWVDSNLPFSGRVPGQLAPGGFTVDLCREVIARVGRRLGRESVELDYHRITFAERFPALDDNVIDLECSATTMTRARMEKYQFTAAYFVAGVRLLVRRDRPVRSLDDLVGGEVAVVAGTTGEALARQHDARATTRIRFRSYDTPELAAKAVLEGQADAFPFDDIILYALMSKMEGGHDALNVVGRFMSVEPYGLMMRGGDEAFQRMASEELAGLLASSRALRLFDRWFNNEDLRAPMNLLTREAFAHPSREPAFP